MAKKASKKSAPEEAAFFDLMKKAKEAMDASQKKQKRENAVKVGKELAMLLCWLQQVEGKDSKKQYWEENSQIWLAQMLKDYPEELKKVLAYYARLKKYNTKDKLLGFTCSSSSLEKGELWVKANWASMEPPAETGEDTGRQEKGQK